MAVPETIAAYWPQIATAISAVIVVVRYAPSAWRVLKQMYALAKALEAITLIPERLDRLEAQVKPNGGTSLRDVIDRMSARLEGVETLNRTRWYMDPQIASFRNDEHGNCTAANLRLCQLFRVPESEIIGMNWRNCVHPGDIERCTREWMEAVKLGQDFAMRLRYQDVDGIPIPALCTAKAMRVAGAVTGWIGIVEPEEK